MLKVEDIVKIIKKVIAPLRTKILLSIGHGIIEVSKDSGDLQFIQATFLNGETKSDVRKMHHFGFSSSAPSGSECIGVSVAGNREAMVVIATENREFRFKNLGDGEVAIYSKDGDYIHLKDGNAIDIKTKTLNIEASASVTIKSPQITMDGESTVTKNLTVDKSANITKDANITGSANVTVDVVATGNVTGAVITGTTSVGAPAIAAQSVVVAGAELAGYEDHTHTYIDDNGSSNSTKETEGVS